MLDFLQSMGDEKSFWFILPDVFITFINFFFTFILFWYIKHRKDFKFNWIFFCFAAFFCFRGFVRISEIYDSFDNIYWVVMSLKYVVASLSVVTAILLVKLLPSAWKLQSEERFRLFFEGSPGPYLILSPKLKIVDANNTFLKTTLKKKEEIIDKYIFDVFPKNPDDPDIKCLEESKASFERVIKNKVADFMPISKHYIFNPKFNAFEERYWKIANSPIFGADNELIYIICQTDDVTDYIRLKTEEDQKNAFTIGLLESSPDAMIVVDEDGRVFSVNTQTEKFFGYSKNEMIGNRIEMLIPERFRKIHPSHRVSFMKENKTRPMSKIVSYHLGDKKMELYGLRKDGSEFPVEISLSPMEFGGKKIVCSAIRDVTERKEIEKKLEDTIENLKITNDQLKSFGYSISHDLRSPLRHISGFATMLKEREWDTLGDVGKRCVQVIVDASIKMDRLIENILIFSRIGIRDLEKISVNVNDVISGIINEMAIELKDRKIKWKISKLPPVNADSKMFTQLLFNLISNAVKYTKKREVAEIEIGFSETEKDITIFIKDNGVGFDEKYADKLFNIFQRLHSDKEFEGSGVGLAIVKRIVDRHKGKVRAEGKVDKGATFYFTLPK